MNVTRLRAIVRKYSDAGTLYAGLCALVCLLACGVSAEGEGVAPPKRNSPAKRSKPSLPQKPLLPACIPLLKVGIRNEGVYWISNDKAIIISRNRDKPYDAPIAEEWHGKVEIFDSRTAKLTLLEGLTHIINSIAYPPENFEVSPNGKWVTWWSWSSGTGYDTKIARLNGQNCQDTHGGKWSTDYWLDGDIRVCQYPTRSEKAPFSILYVLNPDTGSQIEIPATPSEAKAIVKRASKRHKKVAIASRTDNHITIDVFKSEDFYLSFGSPDQIMPKLQSRFTGEPVFSRRVPRTYNFFVWAQGGVLGSLSDRFSKVWRIVSL